MRTRSPARLHCISLLHVPCLNHTTDQQSAMRLCLALTGSVGMRGVTALLEDRWETGGMPKFNEVDRSAPEIMTLVFLEFVCGLLRLRSEYQCK